MKWLGWGLVALFTVLAAAAALFLMALAGIEPEEPPCMAQLNADACREECRKGNQIACNILVQVTRDPMEIRTLNTPLCAGGSGDSCDRLAALEVSFDKKKEIYALGCAAPTSWGPCAKLALLETDPSMQKAALEAGCLGGDTQCCSRFGELEHDDVKLQTVFAESCRRVPSHCTPVVVPQPDAGDGGSAHPAKASRFGDHPTFD